jgi:tol-pal system protein YbgF
VLAGALLLPLVVQAQVQIVEAGQKSSANSHVAAPSSLGADRKILGDLFYQLQMLQEETALLRGQLEEQQNELNGLKQQRVDDYLSLDRRISELKKAAMAPASPGVGFSSSAVDSAAEAAVHFGANPALKGGSVLTGNPGISGKADPLVEKQVYTEAYSLVREQQFAKAKEAFKAYLQAYPNGSYSANGLYWLGELQLLDKELSEAKSTFARLLQEFPTSRKVPDAMFKQAKVIHLQGDADTARQLLEAVIKKYGSDNVSAARLARDYLQQNFTN